MTTPDDRRVFIKLNHNFQPPGITIDHKPFDGAVEYITLADHTRLVKEAVEAEHNRCVDAIKNARARNTKIGSVEWALACEMIAAIRSRGVTP